MQDATRWMGKGNRQEVIGGHNVRRFALCLSLPVLMIAKTVVCFFESRAVTVRAYGSDFRIL